MAETSSPIRWIDAAAWTALLRPGMRVFVSGSSNEPGALLEALAAAPACAAGVTFVQFPVGGLNRFDLSALHEDARHECFFMTPQLASGLESGRVRFLPMQMRAVYDYIFQPGCDLALTQAARDRNGVLRLGPNVDFIGAALASGARLVVEVNAGFTAPLGAPELPPARIEAAVASNRPFAALSSPAADDAARAIGRLVADLVPDGAVVQTGIGAIPGAVLGGLGEKNDLGLHSGLIDDAGLALIERGVVTGKRKSVDRSLHVTGMALGSAALVERLADRPDVVFRGANYTHEVSVIRELEGFYSINSAVEIDLGGAVNSEVAGGRQISGTGGSVDFMRAARASRGGRSIVALNATARGGAVSRIVPRVEMTTALRTDVDLVVTEYGIADLRHADTVSRARQLISIAAPAFRDALTDAARGAGIFR